MKGWLAEWSTCLGLAVLLAWLALFMEFPHAPLWHALLVPAAGLLRASDLEAERFIAPLMRWMFGRHARSFAWNKGEKKMVSPVVQEVENLVLTGLKAAVAKAPVQDQDAGNKIIAAIENPGLVTGAEAFIAAFEAIEVARQEVPPGYVPAEEAKAA